MASNIKTIVDAYTAKTDFVDYNLAAHINALQTALDNLAYATVSQAAFANVETLAGNKTLTDDDASIQVLNPNSADRDVSLATLAVTNHATYIYNSSGSNRLLTVKNSGGTTIRVVPPGKGFWFISDGSQWLVSGFDLYKTISPSQITANQNDYNPTGAYEADIIRLDSDAAWNITGLAGGSAGRVKFLMNVGSFTLTLKNNDVGSTAENRFDFGTDFSFESKKATAIIYDPTSSRWRMVGGGTRETHYKITPTVVSNDLVLTITHADGTTPSACRPLWFLIGNTWRACTAALSVTKVDGTNWANLGSAELGTKEQDLFPYAIWNTNLSGGTVDVLWSRIPYGRLYSDFSGTTTNENYAAINATAPAATDECAPLGRFAATLSLSGTSHVWTVPTYTNVNLVQQPINKTRVLTFTSVITAQSGTPTSTTVNSATYQRQGRRIKVLVDVTLTTVGTATQSVFATAPVSGNGVGFGQETASTGYTVAMGFGVAGANIMSMRKYDATTLWVNGYRPVVEVEIFG